MIPTASQEKFMCNDTNKSRLIGMLQTKFDAAIFMVKQATEDAYTLIVTMTTILCIFDSIIVVGKYVDLIIIFTSSCTRSNLYTRKPYIIEPGKGQILQQIYSTEIILARLHWL